MDYSSYKLPLPFKKHPNKTLLEIYKVDRKYLEWITKTDNLNVVTIVKEFLRNPPQTLTPQNIPITTNNTPTTTRNYGVQYGDLPNLSDDALISMLRRLYVGQNSVNYIYTELKSRGSNLNNILLKAAEEYFMNPNVHITDDPNLLMDLKKIYFAWKYGIIATPLKSTITDTQARELQEVIIRKWDEGKSVNDIVYELTKELNEEEKKFNRINHIVSYRKRCKKIPYLFTPALCQFLMLGLDNEKMKKIYKCYFDDVMSKEKGAFPDCNERISEFYKKLDWKNHYYGFLMNPYAYYNVPLEDCDKILTLTNRSVLSFSFERKLGEFTRAIYTNTKNNNWTATPNWWGDKNFKEELNHKDVLRDYYGMVFDIEYIYLKHIYDEEILVSQFVKLNLGVEEGIPRCVTIPDNIDGMELTDEQRTAIQGVLSRPIPSLSIITGLAGTGKTTIIKGLVRCLKSKREDFVVCSYTAKAKERIIEVLGFDAFDVCSGPGDVPKEICHVRTIHSTIGMIEKGTLPTYVIIDEATMVSLSLFAKLVKFFIKNYVAVIMLGDINQLPGIKPGRPFEDIIDTNRIDIYRLTRILRVKNGSTDPIIINSNNIVKSPSYEVIPADNFNVMKNQGLRDTVAQIVFYNSISMHNVKAHKFITYTNDDASELNYILSSLINPRSQSRNISCYVKRKGADGNKTKIQLKYSIGDPVIFTKNNVYPYVSNGCEGVIRGFTNDNHIIIEYESYDIRVPLYPVGGSSSEFYIKHVLLAYCITVHKAQGSEWSNVYFYINSYPSATKLNKRLAYTAITRAKNSCSIIETRENMFRDTCRTNINKHYGGLQSRITDNNSHINAQIDNISSMMKHVNIGSHLRLN